MWEVEYTDEFEKWWDDLDGDQQVTIAERVALLQEHGPDLGRPAAAPVKTSKNDPRMKELRAGKGTAELRVLFIFDPRRVAILLCGGDKSGSWNKWYETAIPAADKLYDTHLEELRKEGLL